MAYIGNAPAEAYSNIAYQDFGTQSGTIFILDFPAGAPGELEVFVNNVRQEPSVAYTVSGTTLTMTGTVAATDDFYVVFQGKAQQTVTHPSNQALQATSGTFSGNLTVDTDTLKVDSTNNLVGIGTASPSQKLDVVGSSANIRVAESGGGDLRMNVSGSTGGIGTHSNHALLFRTNSTEAMRIDSSGNVGIADTSPVSLLTVNKGNVTGAGQWASSAIALTNPTNIGAYSQIGFGYTPSQTNASSYIGYVSTNQGASGYGDLVFGTRAVNTDTQPSERMRIDSSGRLNIGQTGAGPGNARVNIDPGTTAISIATNDTVDYYVGAFYQSGTLRGYIYTSSTGTAYNTSSDYRLKTAVNYDWDATTRLKQLKPARFEWISDGDDAVPVDGFLAHEVQTVVPEAIHGTHNEVDDDGNPVYQGIDQSKLVPLLVKTIQELEARIAALEAS